MSSMMSSRKCMSGGSGSGATSVPPSLSRALICVFALLVCPTWAASLSVPVTGTYHATKNASAFDPLEADELAADQLSVRELMRWETSQALKRLRADREALSVRSQLRASSATPDLSTASLVAIYGVGRKLMAEIRIDGASLLFMRGRSNAVGPGKSHQTRLLRLTERCAEIAVGERQRVLCAPSHASSGD